MGRFTCWKPAWFSAQIWAFSRVFVPLNPLFPLPALWGVRHSTAGADLLLFVTISFPEMSELLLTEEERTAIPEYVAAILNSHVS